MFDLKKQPKRTVEASGLTSLEQQVSAIKIAELEMRILGLEQAIIELCHNLSFNLTRTDNNIKQLDNNIRILASMTLRPPRNLLNGEGQESN